MPGVVSGRAAAAALTACLWGGAAQAGTWSLVVENDVFAGTDQNYTSGLKLTWASEAARDPGDMVTGGFGRGLADVFYGLETIRARNGDGDPDTDILIHESFALGHSIFTPQDISTAAPLPDQHPYAGWLYGGYSMVVVQEDLLDTFAVDAGVVGPSAFAEEIQRGWHQLIDGEDPKGWDNQLEDEPGIVLTWQRQWRYDLRNSIGRFGFDILPTVGASAGNILTQANMGATFRAGYNLGNDYGPPRIRPALAGSAILDHGAGGVSFYLFAGVEGRAVLQNIFLDGNTFRQSLNVQRKPLVADFQVGAALRAARFLIAYTFVVRTEEFDGQQEPQKFGALSLSLRF
ncbi:MAG: lipid A deacylase LpxR family protein [Alphaproteobacteria bacterium]